MAWKFRIKPGIGERLRQERQRLKLTQEQLAEAIGVSKVTLYSYEKDLSAMDVSTLIRLSEAGVDLSFLLANEKPEFMTAGDSVSIDRLASAFPKLIQYFRTNPRLDSDMNVITALLTGVAYGQSPEEIKDVPEPRKKSGVAARKRR